MQPTVPITPVPCIPISDIENSQSTNDASISKDIAGSAISHSGDFGSHYSTSSSKCFVCNADIKKEGIDLNFFLH